jgi:hypothetical protein
VAKVTASPLISKLFCLDMCAGLSIREVVRCGQLGTPEGERHVLIESGVELMSVVDNHLEVRRTWPTPARACWGRPPQLSTEKRPR